MEWVTLVKRLNTVCFCMEIMIIRILNNKNISFVDYLWVSKGVFFAVTFGGCFIERHEMDNISTICVPKTTG